MIIPGEFAQAYNRIIPTLEKLKAKCDPLLKGVARSAGGKFVENRIKPIESVLLKTEHDGLAKPFEEIDDLLASTIIVPNETLILQVEQEVEKRFEIVERVPPKTRKPEEFIYDDRHFILRVRPEPGREDPELSKLKFELQVKTEMQAAASSISRGLSYKTQRLSWTRTRLVGRIRALVEMVDDLLVKLEKMQEDEPQIAGSYELFIKLNQIIEILEQNLMSVQMPEDKRRLANIVDNYLRSCTPKTSIAELGQILKKPEYTRIREANSLSASESVFMVLFLEGRLSEHPADPNTLRGRQRYLITSEMIDLCPPLRKVPEQRRVQLN